MELPIRARVGQGRDCGDQVCASSLPSRRTGLRAVVRLRLTEASPIAKGKAPSVAEALAARDGWQCSAEHPYRPSGGVGVRRLLVPVSGSNSVAPARAGCGACAHSTEHFPTTDGVLRPVSGRSRRRDAFTQRDVTHTVLLQTATGAVHHRKLAPHRTRWLDRLTGWMEVPVNEQVQSIVRRVRESAEAALASLREVDGRPESIESPSLETSIKRFETCRV
jgi:hypothetical protein